MSKSDFTKYMIAKGMKELIKTKKFENISISELSSKCSISRNTFYYHFRDKYDVISWIFYSDINPIMDNINIDNWSVKLLNLFSYMQENKSFYIKAINIEGQNSFSECLMGFYNDLIYNLIISSNGNQILSKDQIDTISKFYSFGLTGIVVEWAKNGMVDNPEPAIEILEELLSGDLFDKLISLHKKNNI